MRHLALTAALLPGLALASPAWALTPDEADDLTWMREEEKLARDVYIVFHRVFGEQVFENIAWSEQAHVQAVGTKLAVYNLPDPIVSFRVGAFTDPVLDGLFKDLRAEGRGGLASALLVGGFIEEIDMIDLVDAMDRAVEPELDDLYGSLLCGSQNHLRAFVRRYEAVTGLDYQAQALTQAEVDTILAAPQGTCVAF